MRAPDGVVRFDPTGRAPGRGAYLCRDAACWDTAGRKRAIEHALAAQLSPDLLAVLAAGPDATSTSVIGAASPPTPGSDTNDGGGTDGQK